MLVIERNRTVPASTEDVHYASVSADEETYPATTKTFSFSGYTPFYEKMTPNSGGSKREWRSWQHYKSYQPDPSLPVRMPVPVHLNGSYPSSHYIGESRHHLVGYEGHLGSPFWTHRSPYGDAGQLDLGLPALVMEADEEGNFIPPPENLNDLNRRALNAMWPTIKAELSLINSVIELKDFKRPLQSLVRFVTSGGFNRLLKVMRKAGSIGNPSFSALARKGAAGYLQYKFNLYPLYSDIRGIVSALTRTEKRINALLSRAGRVQRKHFSYAWTEFPDVNDDISAYGAAATEIANENYMHTCISKRLVTYKPTTFHAEIEYNYNYSRFQTEHAQWLASLDALGVNMNPAIIWNAIPWSFVVDWVLGVSRALDQLKTSNMEPQINIRRYLWSVSRFRQIYVTKGLRYLKPGWGTENRNPLPVVQQTAYRRTVGLPATSLITSSGLSSTEFSLGAALVIGRRKHRKH